MRMSVKVGVVTCLVIIGVFGCGPKEEKLHRVSGSVTYAGKPVPKGTISFDPTADGPMGFASILDGKYDTTQGGGVRGGKYNIRVNAFNGIAGPDLPFGQALFSEYTGSAELPAEDSTFDLSIPKKQ